MERSSSPPRSAADIETCGTLLVAATGAVAVLQLPHYLKHLRATFADTVRVMLSPSACRFITPYAAGLYADGAVYTDLYQQDDARVPHVELTRQAELFVVMPATAHVLARCAHGLCDGLVTTAVLASPRPVVFVPSMNEAMWTAKATQRNVAQLRADGHTVIEPRVGLELADLKPTFGVMPTAPALVPLLQRVLAERRAAQQPSGSPDL